MISKGRRCVGNTERNADQNNKLDKNKNVILILKKVVNCLLKLF